MTDLDISAVRKRVLAWGGDNYQSYPWRRIEDPWQGLLAEVLLQRTNAKHVDRYFREILALFPNPESVLQASTQELEVLAERFGLRRRLKTILSVAYYLDEHFYYPTDIDDLTDIYGIGHYTAAAFLSLHMHTRAVLVDSNIARWLSRMTGDEKPIDVRRCTWLWEMAEALTPQGEHMAYNYAVLDFTMSICKPRNPECLACPLNDLCDYYRRQGLDSGGL